MKLIDNLLTQAQAARLVDVSPTSVRQWINRRRLPVVMVAGKPMIERRAFEKFAQSYRGKAPLNLEWLNDGTQ